MVVVFISFFLTIFSMIEAKFNWGVSMIVILSDARCINLDNIVMVDPHQFNGQVTFHSSNQKFTTEMSETDYHDLLRAWYHGEKVFVLYRENNNQKKDRVIDFSDFPSVLEGENSPI